MCKGVTDGGGGVKKAPSARDGALLVGDYKPPDLDISTTDSFVAGYIKS